MPKFQKVPKVADGARGPAAAQKVAFEEMETPAELRPHLADGDVLFESTKQDEKGVTAWGWHGYANLQVQLTSFADVVDPVTGVRTSARNRVAKFENGYYKLERKSKTFAEDYKTLTTHPDFGVNKQFWLADDQRKIEDKKEMDRALRFIQRNTELAKELRARLSIGDDLEPMLPKRDEVGASV